MSDTVEVGLLSGRTATVTAALDEEVGALKLRAQTALGMGDLWTQVEAFWMHIQLSGLAT